MHTYIHTYIHTYAHICMCIYIYIYMHIHVYVCIHVCMYVYVYIYIYIHRHTYIHVHNVISCYVILIGNNLTLRLSQHCAVPVSVNKHNPPEQNMHFKMSAFNRCSKDLAPNLPTKIIPAKMRWLNISRKLPMDMRVPPLKTKILLESSPLKSRILVGRLCVLIIKPCTVKRICGRSGDTRLVRLKRALHCQRSLHRCGEIGR